VCWLDGRPHPPRHVSDIGSRVSDAGIATKPIVERISSNRISHSRTTSPSSGVPERSEETTEVGRDREVGRMTAAGTTPLLGDQEERSPVVEGLKVPT
jgi:hypothetical protein